MARCWVGFSFDFVESSLSRSEVFSETIAVVIGSPSSSSPRVETSSSNLVTSFLLTVIDLDDFHRRLANLSAAGSGKRRHRRRFEEFEPRVLLLSSLPVCATFMMWTPVSSLTRARFVMAMPWSLAWFSSPPPAATPFG